MKEQHMKEQYAAPDLKLVGDAHDVVLGSLGVGNDMWGQVLAFSMEFADDPADSIA
jgi:hypothetical protein